MPACCWVGPSRLFLRYIEQVLPSLGETGVVSVTMGDLVPGVHARVSEDEAVARIKGLPAWAALVKEAVRALAKVPQGGPETARMEPDGHADARGRRRRPSPRQAHGAATQRGARIVRA